MPEEKIIEEMGLAYSIYSFYDQYMDTGLFGVYSACSPEKLEKMWKAICGEMDRIAKEPPTKDEIERAKTMAIDNLKVSFESPGSRMGQMAYYKIYYERVLSLEEMIKELNDVTSEGVRELAVELFSADNRTMLALGPVPEKKIMALAAYQ